MHGGFDYRAAILGSLEALEKIWSRAKEAELNTDELLLAQTGEGLNAIQLTAQKNHVDTLQRIWVWAKENKSKTYQVS
jgi:hypothetical protein